GFVHERRVHPAEFEQEGGKVFRGSPRVDLPDKSAASEKNESNFSFKSSVFCSLPPATEVTALGSKYCGISSSSTLVVATSASLSVRIQVLPAASAASAGRSNKSNGPLNGPM